MLVGVYGPSITVISCLGTSGLKNCPPQPHEIAPLEGQSLTAYWVILGTNALTGLDHDPPYPAAHYVFFYEISTQQAQQGPQGLTAKTEMVPPG